MLLFHMDSLNPFVCIYCKKNFYCWDRLQTHVAKHGYWKWCNGRKDQSHYQRDNFKKDYDKRKLFRTHIHTQNEKPHQYAYCQSKSNLTGHIRTRTKEKAYINVSTVRNALPAKVI